MPSIKFHIALLVFILSSSAYADKEASSLSRDSLAPFDSTQKASSLSEVEGNRIKVPHFKLVADKSKETSTGISNVKNIIGTSWDKNIKPLTNIADEKWTSLVTSTTTNSAKLTEAVSETWNKVLGDTQAGDEISDAGSAISSFIIHEINDTTESTTHSAKLIENGKLVDGIWYLSTRLIKDTDTNLANAVQESKLLNTLGRITATSYGGPQGATAYASWYAFKQANK